MIAYQQLDRINKFSGFVETEWTWQIFAFCGGGLRGVVVAGSAYRPSPVA
jgi:hypothetical protein